jgi:hypothetical protein
MSTSGDAPTGLTPRLLARVRADYAADETFVIEELREASSGGQDRERVLAAIVLGAAGDVDRLCELVELSRLDWRDVLCAGGLADSAWAERLAAVLGDA